MIKHNTLKHIAIVANSAWNICNFRRPLAVFLMEKGYRVIAIAPYSDYTSKIEEMGIPFIPLSHLRRKGTNPFQDIRLRNELKKIYITQRIGLALHYTIKPNIYGSFAAANVGIPSIANVTGLGYTFLSKGIASKVAKILYKRAFDKNQMTVFQNPDDCALFLAYNLVSEAKSRVILGSGVDTSLFSPQGTYVNGKFSMLFIGRFLYDKGLAELFDAFEIFAQNKGNVRLDLVGEIDVGNPAAFSSEELKKILKNKKIKNHGYIDSPHRFYNDADAVVLPSYREGLPMVNLEALAMEKPLITTDVPGCRETVKNGENGFLVPPQNSAALAEAMEKMYNLSVSERVEMGKRSRKMAVEEFSTDVVNREYLELIKQIKLNTYHNKNKQKTALLNPLNSRL